MKKIILLLLTILVSFSLFALPAKPGKVRYTQPDGTTIVLELHGKSHTHWYTNESGQLVEKDKDGFWRPVLWKADWRALQNSSWDDDDDDDDWDDDDDDDDWDDDWDDDDDDWDDEEEEYEPITTGTRHFPVILVNFTDVKFSVEDPVTRFSNMLNQKGYSYNGATGSVRDYYEENSGGIFEPVFDVYGPYQLEHEMAYYGADFINGISGYRDDERSIEVLYEGFQHLIKDVGVSRYDSNGDGIIDMVLVFFAGYNQAEHGPEDSIWPYAEMSPYMTGVSFKADGVRVGRFFMTSELRGYTGTTLAGIGPSAHEFAHALGLPDFYDVDEAGSGGKAGGMYSFSLMDYGCYNNDAKTPPYLSSEERIMLGWMSEEEVSTMPNGNVSLEPVNRNKAIRSYTDIDGEYFVYEYRSGQGWDAGIPEGLLIYHVDKSKRKVLGGYKTPYSMWEDWMDSNKLNSYGGHPCCYVIPADDQTNLNYDYKGNLDKMIFPGSKSVSQFTPVDWVGSTTGVSLSGISSSGGAVWKADVHIDQRILGTVTSTVGVPVPGARVIVHPLEPASEGVVSTTADADGNYQVLLTGLGWEKVSVRASAEGYASSTVECEPHPRKSVLPLQLLRSEDAHDVSICYIDYEEVDDEDEGTPIGSRNTRLQCAMYVPAADLVEHVGKQIKQIRFKPSFFISEARSVDVFIENGEKELLRIKDVPISEEIWYTVDIRDYNLFVEKDESFYVGWQMGTPDYGFSIFPGTNLYITEEETAGVAHNWSQREYMMDSALACKLVLGEETLPNPYKVMGVNSIQQESGYQPGDTFEFQLITAQEDAPAQVTWTFDGAPFEDGDAVQLEAGHHYVEAVLLYSDGRKEILETELEV